MACPLLDLSLRCGGRCVCVWGGSVKLLPSETQQSLNKDPRQFYYGPIIRAERIIKRIIFKRSHRWCYPDAKKKKSLNRVRNFMKMSVHDMIAYLCKLYEEDMREPVKWCLFCKLPPLISTIVTSVCSTLAPKRITLLRLSFFSPSF